MADEMTATDRVEWTLVKEVTGEGRLTLTGGGETIATEGRFEAALAVDQVERAVPRLQTPGFALTHGVQVMFSELSDDPDGPCAIEVQDASGTLLVSGVGESPGDALSSVFEHMLPPASEEYLSPDDGMPDHDR